MGRGPIPFIAHSVSVFSGPPSGVGAGVFALSFLFISQVRLKALFFSAQDMQEIFNSIFILYLFQPPRCG